MENDEKNISKGKNIPDEVMDGKNKVNKFLKNGIYDFVAIGLIAAMLALILDVLKLKELSLDSFLDLVIGFVPLYLVALLLNVTYYNKGVRAGKYTDGFITIIDYYSQKVDDLSGEKLIQLPIFCEDYNNKALLTLQATVLKKISIDIDLFDKGCAEKKQRPLKVLTRKELKALYNKNIAKTIRKASKMTVCGINNNVLLGNYNSADKTNLGPNEKQLKKRRTAGYGAGYVFSLALLTVISIKNILNWNWWGIVLILFKLLYIVCKALLRYFEGYEDIVNHLSNHISRKTDILKEYDAWYDNNVNKNTVKNIEKTKEQTIN